MFINNKYKTWHDNIIEKAKNRVLEGYKEIHHILPRSLGGKDNKANLVALTAKEHFIVHILLCKFTTGIARRSMLYAHNAMSYYIKEGRDYKIGSRIAEKLRKELKFSPEHIENLRKSHLGKPSKRKGFKASKETIAKLKLVNLGKKASEETKAKLRLARKDIIWVIKDDKSERIKKHLLQEYLDKGYKVGRNLSFMTEKYRKNMSKTITKIWQDRKVA